MSLACNDSRSQRRFGSICGTATMLACAALLAGATVLGCGDQGEMPPSDLIEIAHPDLAPVEDAARRQLTKQRSTLESMLGKKGNLRQLAGAFGGLGELYHTYELLPAAVACYRNAERLDPQSFLWPYYLGAALQSQGDLNAAAESLEHALTIRDDDLPAHLRLGEVRLDLGQPVEANDHFARLDSDDRFAAAGHFGLGRAAGALGEALAAVEHFEKALELQPAAGIVHYSLGLALRQAGRVEEAQTHLEEKGSGEVLAPDRLMERLESLALSSGAHLKRGNRAMVNGRLDEAVSAFRQAVAANPESGEARRNLALVLMRQGDSTGATKELEDAVASGSEDVWIHFDLGNAYLAKGDGERAVGAFQRAIELDPKLATAHFNLANTLISLERWTEAKSHLATVLEIEPADRRARYLSAMANHHSGETEAGLGALRRLLREDPTDTVARQGLASILVEAKRRPEAAVVYREGLDLDLPPEEKIALLQPLAKITWRLGQREPAIVYWRQATELAPESSPAFTELANALQLADRRQEARELFARAVELDPENATAALSEASLWILDREFVTARQRLESALAKSPENPGLNHTLARLLATSPSARARDGRRALALSRKAYGLDNSLEHAETVGMALAELGQFEEAIRWQQSLLQRAALTGDRNLIVHLATNLKLYENRRRVRISE